MGTITLGFEPTGKMKANGEPVMRQVRRSVTGKTKREVVAKLDAVRAAAAQGLNPARETLTVGRFLSDWRNNVLPGTVKPATEAQYADVIRLYLAPRIGRYRLKTLLVVDVTRMLRDMAEPTAARPSGYSPTARRLARSVLRRALRHAEAEGMISRNVAALASAVKQDRIEARSMTPAHARTFIESIRGHPLEAAFVVALACGLRLSELLGLEWDHLELDADPSKLLVRRGLKRIPKRGLVLDDAKTNRSRRAVVLPPIATEALRAHRLRQAEQRLRLGPRWTEKPLGADLVFRTSLGTPIDPSNAWRQLSNATQAAGLGHWHPHELRHSSASLLLSQGVPLKSISDLLGHTSISITSDLYAHLLDEQRAETAAAMNRVLGAD